MHHEVRIPTDRGGEVSVIVECETEVADIRCGVDRLRHCSYSSGLHAFGNYPARDERRFEKEYNFRIFITSI